MLNNFNPNSNDPNNPGSSGNSGATMTPPSTPYPWAAPDDGDDFDPEEYLINYNKKYVNEKPTLFRDEVIQQTLSCLIGIVKPNALLIGPAGVGKTKIAEDIARRIACKDASIPAQLLDYTVWELPLTNIVAGSGIVGEVERKTKAILEFAQNPDNKVILFIDEIHMLVGEHQTYDKIAQIMKPALARGDMKVIGATTSQESQNLLDDPAFNRRFTRLIVDELSKEQTIEILKNMQVKLFNHYNNVIAINDDIIKEVVNVADEYKTVGSHRPDNAITLIDRAMADAYIERKMKEADAIASNDTALINAYKAMPTISLSKSQMKKTAMKLMTGNNTRTDIDIDSLTDALSVIKGQDNIIEYMVDKLARDNLNIYPRTKPLSFLFAGHSGVGKTEIAKIIANTITGTKLIILNMTEFNSPASINRIIGSPAGYVGSDSKTELPFDILETNPYQYILLDEFEKADKAVQRLFMNAFEEGWFKTSRGKIVDFSKTVIIATTNAGYTAKSDPIGFTSDNQNSTEATISELSVCFDKELLNRFTKVLNFNSITEDIFKDILASKYKSDVARIKSAHSSAAIQKLPDELTDAEINEFVKEHYIKEFGARHVSQIIQEHIEDLLMANKIKKTTLKSTTDGDVSEIDK